MVKTLGTWGKDIVKNINDNKIPLSYSFRDTIKDVTTTAPKTQRFLINKWGNNLDLHNNGQELL